MRRVFVGEGLHLGPQGAAVALFTGLSDEVHQALRDVQKLGIVGLEILLPGVVSQGVFGRADDAVLGNGGEVELDEVRAVLVGGDPGLGLLDFLFADEVAQGVFGFFLAAELVLALTREVADTGVLVVERSDRRAAVAALVFDVADDCPERSNRITAAFGEEFVLDFASLIGAGEHGAFASGADLLVELPDHRHEDAFHQLWQVGAGATQPFLASFVLQRTKELRIPFLFQLFGAEHPAAGDDADVQVSVVGVVADDVEARGAESIAHAGSSLPISARQIGRAHV